MKPYTTVKVFDLSTAPLDIQETAELQLLRSCSDDEDVPMLKLWVGERATTAQPQVGDAGSLTVTFWEHRLHGWLSRAGAIAGDTVFLTWTNSMSLGSAASAA